AALTAASNSLARRTSARYAAARPPERAMSSLVSFAAASSRSSAATAAPRAAIICAIARPMPEPAPVTTAMRPFSVSITRRPATHHARAAYRDIRARPRSSVAEFDQKVVLLPVAPAVLQVTARLGLERHAIILGHHALDGELKPALQLLQHRVEELADSLPRIESSRRHPVRFA